MQQLLSQISMENFSLEKSNENFQNLISIFPQIAFEHLIFKLDRYQQCKSSDKMKLNLEMIYIKWLETRSKWLNLFSQLVLLNEILN